MKKHIGLTASQLRLDPETSSKSLASLASSGLFPGNTHILPPTDRLDLFWARVTFSEQCEIRIRLFSTSGGVNTALKPARHHVCRHEWR
jgi:hypothetical protein